MIGEMLLDALTKIEKIYIHLIKIASLKKEAILINDYDGLVKITGDEQKLISQLEMVEAERLNALNIFLKEKGLPLNTNLSFILSGALIASEAAQTIKDARDRLIRLNSNLKALNEENNLLISSSKEIIEKSLEFVKNNISGGGKTAVNKSGAYSNYKKTGVNGVRKNSENIDSALLNFIV